MQAREQSVEMVRDKVVEQHEAPFGRRSALDRDEARQRRRNLHPSEVQLDALARRLLELDREREREIRDVRERMPAVDRERREHREDGLIESFREGGLRLVVELAHVHQADSFALERRQQLVVEHAHLQRQRGPQPPRDRLQMLGRCAAVLGPAHDLRLDLLFDRGDADHEELVEVRAVDRNELQALHQWIARVERLFENAVVEFEPR